MIPGTNLPIFRLATEHTNCTFCQTEKAIGAMGGQKESSFTVMESIHSLMIIS